MFSSRGAVELGKGLAKVAVVATIGYVLLKGMTPQIDGSVGRAACNGAIGHSAALAGYSLLVLCCGLAVIAAVDVPFQLWQHAQRAAR